MRGEGRPSTSTKGAVSSHPSSVARCYQRANPLGALLPPRRRARRSHLEERTGRRANKEDQMTDKTAIQRIKELDQERAALFEHAKEEAMRRANQAVEDLNALGLDYRLVTGAAPPGSKSTRTYLKIA